MDILLERRDDSLLAIATGQLSFDDAVRNCRNMCDFAAGLGLRTILFDCLALQGDVSAEERFELGKHIAEYCQSRLNVPAMAVIGRPPAVTGLGARIATNRGMPVEMFLGLTARVGLVEIRTVAAVLPRATEPGSTSRVPITRTPGR